MRGAPAAIAALAALVFGQALAQTGPTLAATPQPPAATDAGAQCRDPGAAEGPSAPSLPHFAAALRDEKKAAILAVGGSGLSRKGRHGEGYFGLVRRHLERDFKGVEVTIAHRGSAGALARDAGETIRVEAALTGAKLVLWQVGTGDALARIAPEEFRADLVSAIDWLKAHRIDVMLVGLHYSAAMREDAHYQQIRAVLREVASEKGVPRIRRYEAAETLARIRAAREGEPLAEVAQDCFADWLAQAVAVGLYGRRGQPPPGAPSGTSP
jgi:hypothetical protein